MDNSLTYADIIQNTLNAATKDQPSLQQIRIYPVCDRDSGNFLVLATGWDKQKWINAILFHARLVDRTVIIEEDNFEEGLTSALINAGIDAENICNGDRQHLMVSRQSVRSQQRNAPSCAQKFTLPTTNWNSKNGSEDPCWVLFLCGGVIDDRGYGGGKDDGKGDDKNGSPDVKLKYPIWIGSRDRFQHI